MNPTTYLPLVGLIVLMSPPPLRLASSLSLCTLGCRDAFDWERARKLGRTEPKEGQDPAYEAALAQGKEAEAALESVLKRWRTKLRDPSIAYWTPGGSTTEPFQLTVSEVHAVPRSPCAFISRGVAAMLRLLSRADSEDPLAYCSSLTCQGCRS
jgi:hypothetical protein